MRIAVYTIALNEREFVDRWVNSVQDADCLLVADTGSSDGTAEALRDRSVTVHNIAVKPWRFDDARNSALSLIPSDVDVCISMDMDEYMEPGWRQHLERCWVEGTTRLRYTYVHSFNAQGEPLHSFMADKAHARFHYRWRRPVHETVFSSLHEQIVTAPDVIMNHKQDGNKSRGQYLPLLIQSYQEFPDCSQTLYWLAREFAFHNRNEEAVEHFRRYLDMTALHGWLDERSEAMNWLSKLMPHEKLKWLRLSVAEAPQRREAWLNLAEHYYNECDWPNLYAAAQSGLAITQPSNSYLDYPHAWGGKLWDLAGLGAWNLGLKEKSLEMFEQAAQREPQDARIQNNLRYVQNILTQG